MSGSAMFVQPPGSVPIPMLADADGQCYYASGGISRFPQFFPTTSAGSYVAGQAMGNVGVVNNCARSVGNGSGIIYGAVCIDPSRNVVPLDILLFSAYPTASTFTDKSEAVLNIGDASKLIGNLHVTDWTVYGSAAGCSIGNVSGGGQFYQLGKNGAVVNTNMFVLVVARGSMTVVSGLNCFLKLLPD